jgi:hypothetical protein
MPATSGADPSASPRDLFLHAPVFEILDGDAFILQVQGVYTHIHSRGYGGGERWRRTWDFSLSRGGSTSRAGKESLSNRSIRATATEEHEKP